MSRDSSRGEAVFSPTQRRACFVMAGCILAVILTFVASWIVLPGLLAGSEPEDPYDPDLYKVDTTLTSVLPRGTEQADYMTGTVVIGDQFAASLQSQNLITLNQYAGSASITLSNLLQEPCVYFADDPASYTIPQALVKMKPRRVVLVLGSGMDGTYTPGSLVSAYRQVISAISTAYAYCDIIVNAVPPVAAGADKAPERQTAIDQCNQALAQMCADGGYAFLNSAETLKNTAGYAESAYFTNAGTFTAAGGNELLQYLRSHPYVTQDRRPDTADIPQRVGQAGASINVPADGFTATYEVEDAERGSLSSDTETGLTKLEKVVAERDTVTVTAVPAAGWSFLRWSDGQTTMTRTDIVTRDISYVAIFAKPGIKVTRDDAEVADNTTITIKEGESVKLVAKAMLDNADYGNVSAIQWTVNGALQAQGIADYTIDEAAGTYTVVISANINGGTAKTTVIVVVEAPTAISLSGTTTIPSGGSTQLAATVTGADANQTQWRCDGYSWTAQGATVTFEAPANDTGAAKVYVVRATNNGVEAVINITVNPAPPPTQEPTAKPTEEPEQSPSPSPSDGTGEGG